MKKMLLLLAGMACLGMFVSCSDDPQEVVVSYDQGAEGYRYTYYGTTTGMVVSTSYSAVTVDSEKPFATIAYEDNVREQTNVKTYTLTVPVKVTETYYGGGTYTNTVYPEITLLDVNGTYYCGKEEIKANASPKSSEFTLTGTMRGYDNNSTYTFSTVTFKRK